MTAQDLRKMKLHETRLLQNEMVVTRVPGGWIYTQETVQLEPGELTSLITAMTSTFVPLSQEKIVE